MDSEYSVPFVKNLEHQFTDLTLLRPMRKERYDAGDSLSYEVTSVADGRKRATVLVQIEKFVGGGFAGQVYKVKLASIDSDPIDGLATGRTYAMKILIPPSRGSQLFRNFLYGIGFQGPFQLQCNPAAARCGALWQKFIRRGAQIRFNDNQAVNDIHATFVDTTLGSCGELSEWVDGRTWRLEVDEYLDLLKRWKKGRLSDTEHLGSPEFRTKKRFMADFVSLLHDMGAHEFARQYEWSTWKSQPNALKRTETDTDPFTGLIAVDFRAGLALLPFLPMSPGDVKLILQGIGRGSLMQFDRGSISKLERFINAHRDDFTDLLPLLEELKEAEKIYRNAIPDITHNHIRLFYSKLLWSNMLDSAVTGWRIKNIIDEKTEVNLRKNRFLTILFILIGLIPFLGTFFRRIFGHGLYRKHYARLLCSPGYLIKSIHGRIIEKTISWLRAERIVENTAQKITLFFLFFLYHLPFSLLPAGLHKFFTNWDYCRERLDYILLRPFRLYFSAPEREAWFRDMLEEGKKKLIITAHEAEEILSQMKEPFIQKYLKSLAVHVLTLPVTQIVSGIVALIFWVKNPGMSEAERTVAVAGILVLFQVIPLSPGSLTRGFYVLYLVIRERNFRDYNIAVFLGFFKYIGYLAFPIQMAYKYPVIARFMAGHWATEAVHIVPVFGESGALLEHSVFNLFYNRPLTIRRRMRERFEQRAQLQPRFWHVPLISFGIACLFGFVDYTFLPTVGALPTLRDIWWLTIILPFSCGSLITLYCGGAILWKRIIAAVIGGMLTGILYTGFSAYIGYDGPFEAFHVVNILVWRIFVFSIFSTIGTMITEIR